VEAFEERCLLSGSRLLPSALVNLLSEISSKLVVEAGPFPGLEKHGPLDSTVGSNGPGGQHSDTQKPKTGAAKIGNTDGPGDNNVAASMNDADVTNGVVSSAKSAVGGPTSVGATLAGADAGQTDVAPPVDVVAVAPPAGTAAAAHPQHGPLDLTGLAPVGAVSVPGAADPRVKTVADPQGSERAGSPPPGAPDSGLAARAGICLNRLIGAGLRTAHDAEWESALQAISRVATLEPRAPDAGLEVREMVEPWTLPAPSAEGLPPDLVRFNAAGLEQDLQSFLDQIDQLGGELIGVLRGLHLSPWLMAVAVTAAAGEMARRRQRQWQRGLAAGDAAAAGTTWFTDLTGYGERP
jgi:hypothetical protein